MESPIPTYGKKWHEYRTTHVGASEIGALLGLSPFANAYDVWDSKNNEHHLQVDSGVNTHVWWGHRDEPSIIEAAVREIWAMNPPWIRTGMSWIYEGFMVSPDAVATKDHTTPKAVIGSGATVIEAKSVGVASATQWKKGPPLYVKAQVHAQMAILKASQGFVAARLAGGPAKVWEVEKNQEIEDMIVEIVNRFWHHQSKPAHWDEFIHKCLLSVGWVKDPKTPRRKEVTLEEASVLLAWADAKNFERQVRKQREELDRCIKDIFGEEDELVIDGRVLAFSKNIIRESVDLSSLAADHPEIVNKYTRKTEYTTYRNTPERNF